MSEKLVKDLSYEAHFRMSMLLLPPNTGRDWKTLADKMGYSNEEIKYFECRNDPVLDLISDYESKGKVISELLSFLEEMERVDLIEDLQKFIEATPTPEELRLEWEMRQTEAAENSAQAKTVSEWYDAYIAYAKPDKPFAQEIVETLENPPYSMKVCTDYRDLLAGGDHLDNVAKAIQTRCGKVLLILSENFNRCQDADFVTNFVLSLSPDVKKRILIPIVYTPCKIPSMLGFITRLDYTSERERRYFWNRLTLSLGYSNSRTCNGKT